MFTLPTAPKPAVQSLSQDGLSLLASADLVATLPRDWAAQWETLVPSWNRLPPDAHLKDGGHYRQRRHSCFVQDLSTGELTQTPHRAHWQPTDYNALHGGFERWFDPVEDGVATDKSWVALLSGLGQLFAQVRPGARWFVEAHQFRIDTAGGVGRPTPEGAHRDGVDFVVVLLVARHGVKGGETRVFDANGPHGLRFVMQEPLTTLLLDDARVIHETTPILPVEADTASGHRDTLVLTYRAAGFQAP
ncbi:MAG TPA: 2OG-Fe dioxygenase family protein [Polaromonas sp.]|uniref:2OG-Fe dioxygenase family protein n=1 Tax=Polaromonas sp. TaxID=1869339 RepID=UPI002D3AA3F8|nr:2OG-Fe dioxygenase family protein [Polaromonas sp.]HYW58196.1 2OG-Fe dioxygenase family protein [Polaromonas sp.]